MAEKRCFVVDDDDDVFIAYLCVWPILLESHYIALNDCMIDEG
jgi:hypothetical protein